MSGRIVVGVDGSEGSDAALTWALQEAHLRHASVEVVHAWQFSAIGELAAIASQAATEDLFAAEATTLLETTVEELQKQHPEVPISGHLEHGGAATSLIEAAKGADLLVVGSRGRGGFSHLLLGSVSHQCVMHAVCPVVVVRGEFGADGES